MDKGTPCFCLTAVDNLQRLARSCFMFLVQHLHKHAELSLCTTGVLV